jgi:hypothetical protein
LNARRNHPGSFLHALTRVPQVSALVFILCVGLAGCRRNAPPFTIPVGVQAPAALEDPSSAELPSAIAVEPPPDFGPLPSVNPPAPPQRRRLEPKEEAPSTPQPTEEAAPAELAIGSLSTGTDATPQIQQQAQDKISSLLKRLNALSVRTVEAQKRQVRQVRHFLDQAQQALNTGDTEGAKNLATKAGLLMDDLEKK